MRRQRKDAAVVIVGPDILHAAYATGPAISTTLGITGNPARFDLPRWSMEAKIDLGFMEVTVE